MRLARSAGAIQALAHSESPADVRNRVDEERPRGRIVGQALRCCNAGVETQAQHRHENLARKPALWIVTFESVYCDRTSHQAERIDEVIFSVSSVGSR